MNMSSEHVYEHVYELRTCLCRAGHSSVEQSNKQTIHRGGGELAAEGHDSLALDELSNLQCSIALSSARRFDRLETSKEESIIEKDRNQLSECA